MQSFLWSLKKKVRQYGEYRTRRLVLEAWGALLPGISDTI